MGLLDGKTALIFGVANKDSIAWGIAQAMHREGATIALSYGLDKLERRVRPLAEQVNCDFVELCDVSSDEELDAVFEKYKAKYGSLDILVHSIGFAPREDLGGRFSEMSRDGFRITLDISAYSLIALAQRAKPLMSEGGSIMAMTYYAAEKVIPGYNSMAIAKAALELSTRYLAADLGPDGIRVNAISAGPIKTLAAAGIEKFRKMMNGTALVAPLRKLVSQEEVGDAAVWLASDWSRSVTGEILHVDAGYNVLGMTLPEEELD
jgi:enoyl-[acyl-carrier protein] reductase I